MAFPLHPALYSNSEPYFTPDDGASEPKAAASASGMAQVAPPIVPATVEQQARVSAATQYGGANPFSTTDRSALLIAGGVLLAGIAFLRSK